MSDIRIHFADNSLRKMDIKRKISILINNFKGDIDSGKCMEK